MEVAMEVGTLKELNVKPGDVVEPESNTDGTEKFEVMADCRLRVNYSGGGCHVFDRGWYWDHCIFRIVSRATPAIDLTAITTPFGLLDATTQDALLAHGGPYEYYYGGKWYPTDTVEQEDYHWVHRVKPAAKRETVTVKGLSGSGKNVILTVDLIDGKPDLNTVRQPR